MVAADEAVAALAARSADVLGHSHPCGQHGGRHGGMHPRGREPEEGHGAELPHLAEAPQRENRGGEGEGRGGVDNDNLMKASPPAHSKASPPAPLKASPPTPPP